MSRPVPAPGREIELKLAINPRDLPELLDHPMLVDFDAATEKKLEATYYDTADHDLRRAGIGFRVRKEGERHVMTVKAPAGARETSSGLAVRREWEWIVPGPGPDLGRLRADAVESDQLPDILFALTEGELKPVFAVDVTRRAQLLRPDPVTEIELAIDQGVIRAGAAQRPVCEIELELKRGGLNRLYGMALDLRKAAPVRVLTASKAARGYALVTGESDLPAPAAPELTGILTAEEALARLTRATIDQLLAAQEPLLIHGRRDALEALRDALARLLVLFALYDISTLSLESAWLRGDLEWLADEIGCRDAEAHDIRRHGDMALRQINLNPGFKDEIEQAQTALKSPRYTTIILTLGLWAEERRWRQRIGPEMAEILEKPFRAALTRWLRAAWVRLLARTEARHPTPELSRSLGQLGEAVMLSDGIWPHAEVAGFARALKPLADLTARWRGLRRLHDSAQGEAALKLQAQIDACVAEMPAAWKPITQALPYWEQG